MRSIVHDAANLLMSQIRAFEYMVVGSELSPRTVFLKELRQKRLNGDQMKQLVQKTHNTLNKKWLSAAQQMDNCGTPGWSHTDISLASIPGNQFASTGKITVSVQPPALHPGYWGMVFSGAPRVYLLGLSGKKEISIDLVRTGSSVVLDKHGKSHMFTSERTDPVYATGYNPTTCDPNQEQSRGVTTQMCHNSKNSLYINLSPYGTWELTVRELELQRQFLQSVTTLRFVFHLAGLPISNPKYHGARYAFDNQKLHPRPSQTVCHPEPPQSPPPPPSPPPPLPPSPSGCDSCSTFPQFNKCVNFVSKSCCDGPSEKCVNSLPTTCNIGCGRVLHPMLTTCKQLLAKSYMTPTKTALEKTAAKCPASSKPCTNIAQMDAYAKAVKLACCSKAGSCTSGGVPKVCNGHCAGALVPMSRACTPFLKSKSYFGPTLKSLQTATKSCVGGGH